MGAGLFSIGALALLLGKLFHGWTVEPATLALYLIVWIPFILPFLHRLKYKDIELEFVERVKQVEAEVADLANENEIGKDEKKGFIDPYTVRLRYTSARVDEKYFAVRVWLDAPPEFLSQVDRVIFERHSTFRNRFVEVANPPFEDRFKCWGEFTMRAEIRLKSGKSLRRQRYLALEDAESDGGEGE